MINKALLALPLVYLASPAFATPLEQRQVAPGLIDGLLTGVLDPIRQSIKDILTGVKSGVADGEVSSKPLLEQGYDVSAELTKRFKETNGQCNDAARAAIRFGFHDAGAWDKDTTTGGADGSLMMDFGEIDRPENNGLQSVRLLLREVQAKFKVGYADLAQYAHNHATISCPKGPRIRTWVGRKDATGPAPEGKLPDVHDTPDNLIALFERKGFSAHDLAALVGAHAAAKQRFVDTSQAGKPLDTTPGVWDVEFYNDTLQEPQNPDIFVLPSDKKLSVHPKINDEWVSFVGDQPHWNEDYAKAYIRMSLTGVEKDVLKGLKDCTRTLPKKTNLK
ncbi:hypothetical protein SLS60_005874 [Paraconiothyrium brasiliense]|uniref:Peroxidase n=1 Tax=Paraconiothyrium brasiliense TaxID=300254 RepID=A0ABR3RDZ8_9PLEO